MTDRNFDTRLQEELTQLPPPEDVIAQVTPWRKAMNRVLTGLALNAVTLNFLALDYILPAIGTLLLVLGFRSLRRENRSFRLCWLLSLWKAAYTLVCLTLNATIWGRTIFQTSGASLAAYGSCALYFVLLLAFWSGLRNVKEKAGLPPHAGSAAALILWYIPILIPSFLSDTGILPGIIIIAAFFLILRSLFRLSRELDQAGYAIQAAPVAISDRTLALLLSLALALGLTIGYGVFSQYPMDWAEAPAAEKTDLRDSLLALGFPKAVLEDLTEADLARCQGAESVLCSVQDHPVNPGRWVTEEIDGVISSTLEYDVKELRVTGVAVKLSGEEERWVLFHHFSWEVAPGFHGTEALQFWPANYQCNDWSVEGDYSGRVLYDDGGLRYAAPFYRLGRESYIQDNWFLGRQKTTEVFAEFSFPAKGEHCRGYVAYEIQSTGIPSIVNSWMNYLHRSSSWQYPVRTAKEYRIQGGGFWSDDRVLSMVQTAIQFNPWDEDPDFFS